MLSFKNSCFKAASRFVQTAVVIDDEARYFDDEANRIPSGRITDPIAGLTSSNEPEPTTPKDSFIHDESELDDTLNIDRVVNGFAELKITCGVQRPKFGAGHKENAKLKEWALNCATHADITILDWLLFEKDKRLVEDIIVDILKKDQEFGGKIRLFCIYTAQSTSENIW